MKWLRNWLTRKQETAEQKRERIRNGIAEYNRRNIFQHVFYEGETGYFRNQK